MPLKIGELASRTGITVRTLHHYDEVGLLCPSARTPSGHRLYNAKDIEQLHAILALQQLGLSLNDIKQSLKDNPMSFEDIILKQRNWIDAQLKEHRELQRRIMLVEQHLSQNEHVSVDEIIELIGVMVMYEKNYSEEQIETLKARQGKMSQQELDAIEQEWSEIFEAYKKAYKQGKAFDDSEVMKLANRSLELIEDFTGGDPEMKASFNKMYETEGGSNVLAQHGMEVAPEVFELIAKSMGHISPK